MKRYILKRVLQLVPILFGITLLSFILMNVGTADVIDGGRKAGDERRTGA